MKIRSIDHLPAIGNNECVQKVPKSHVRLMVCFEVKSMKQSNWRQYHEEVMNSNLTQDNMNIVKTWNRSKDKTSYQRRSPSAHVVCGRHVGGIRCGTLESGKQNWKWNLIKRRINADDPPLRYTRNIWETKLKMSRHRRGPFQYTQKFRNWKKPRPFAKYS